MKQKHINLILVLLFAAGTVLAALGNWNGIVTGGNALTGTSLNQFGATSSAELLALLSDKTGSGLAVFATSPTLTTPNIGVATATTVNKLTLTEPATSATLTVADGKTMTVSRTMTLTSAGESGVLTLPNATATIPATSDNLSVFAATTSAQLDGVLSDNTGSGLAMFATGPVFNGGSSSAGTKPKLTSGTVLATTEAGAMEFDGKVKYFTPVIGDRGVEPSVLMRMLLANATGNDSATAQGWFPTSGAVSVRASTAYRFQGAISIVRTAGATAHTTGVSMDGGTCTITAIGYHVEVKEGDAATISDSDLIAIQVATDTNIKASSTSASENIVFMVWGTVWVNAAGTFKPMFKYSAAPGGAPSIEVGSYFMLYPIGDNTVTTIGTWQ